MQKLVGLDFLAASAGTLRFGVETITGAFSGFRISQNSEITQVLDQNGTDITAAMGLGAGKTLYAGEVHAAATAISKIVCGAGSGVAILGVE